MSRDEAFKAREKRTHKMTRDGLIERNEVTGEESRISSREQDFKLRERLTDGTAVRDRPSTAGRSGHARRRPQTPLSQDLRQENADFHSQIPDVGSPNFVVRQQESKQQGKIYGSRHQHDLQYQRKFQADVQRPMESPVSDTDAALPDTYHSIQTDTLRSDERPGRLRFDPAAPASSAGASPKQHGTEYAQKFSTAPSKPDADTSAGSTSGAKPSKPSRLQFAKDESPLEENPGKPDKRLEKSHLKAERYAENLTSARKKLPTRRKPRLEKTFDSEKGEMKRTLRFEKEVKSQREHLKGTLPLRPVKSGANAVIGYAHTKIYQAEQENVGVEAGHKGELFAEGVVRRAYRLHKTAPYRRVAKWERLSWRHTVRHAYRQALHDNPRLQSSPLSRFLQKQKIKRQYAKMAREAKHGAKAAKAAGKSAGRLTRMLAGVLRRHPVGGGIALALLLMVFIFMSTFGSCSNMAVGILSSVAAGSFVAEDKDIDDAELAYTEWETDLQIKIQNAERDHPGFDEYKYNVDDISHNPYELLAFLTAKYQDFTFAGVEAELSAIFDQQYTLVFEEEVEIRTRTVTRTDPETGEEYEDEEEYEWYILNVSLTARSFSELVSSRLSGEEREHFDVLLSTRGNRQYALNPFSVNWLPYITSYYGWRVHPISGEKDYHKGIDIALPAGTEILATHDGRVTLAGDSGGYGLVVVLEDGKGLVTKYAHCAQLLVSTGQDVKKGDYIATLGSTGNSTGPHLHFEVIYNGQYLNPLFFSETGDDGTGSLPPGSPGGVEFPEYPGEPMRNGSYAALMAEAQKHLGKPYVFGAKGPDTFDCSGFVCWSLSKSGIHSIATNAQGLYNATTPVSPENARPGDLIFFHSTYSTHNTVTHVGIYIGNGKMLHAGKPVQYASIDTWYWQEHFYAFGRTGG